MSEKMKRPTAKLIANPGAGKPAESAKNLEMATRTLMAFGLNVDVALARPKKEAVKIARKAVADGYKILIALGGDGTIEAVMRGMLRANEELGKKASLGILPAGTANNIARSLGIPLDLTQACSLIAANRPKKIDVGRVKTSQGKIFYFFELAAIGLTAALYPEAKRIPKGNLASIKDALTTLVQAEACPKISLKIDGESLIEDEALLVTVSNTPEFGLNFLVAPKASLDDGLLDVSVYSNFTKAELLAYYVKVRNDGAGDNQKIQRYRAHKLRIETTPDLQVMADGIMLDEGPLRIKACPGLLRVIAPEQGAGLALPKDAVGLDVPAPLPVTEAIIEGTTNELKEK